MQNHIMCTPSHTPLRTNHYNSFVGTSLKIYMHLYLQVGIKEETTVMIMDTKAKNARS